MATDVRTREEAMAALAATLGGTDDGIREVGSQDLLELLAGNCVLVEVNIGRWGARARWTPEEWGVQGAAQIRDPDTRDAVRELYQYGEKYLLPAVVRGRLEALAMQGRKNLYRHAFTTPWGWMVPVAAYRDWKAHNDELQAEYEGAVGELCCNLERHLREVAARYRLQAVVAYRRTLGADVNDETLVPSNSFVETFVRGVLDAVPSREAIRSRFYWRASAKLIVLPSVVEAERQKVDEIRTAGNQVRALRQAEFDEALRVRREIADQMLAEKRREIDGVMRELTAQFRGHVHDVVTEAAASIQRNDGRLVGKVAERLRNLVAWAQQMNVTDDLEVRAALARLQAQLGQPRGDRDVADVAASLEALQVVTRATLVELGTGVAARYARHLDADARVRPEELRRARRTLGLNGDVAPLGLDRPAARTL